MITLGISGFMGSGKSYVCRTLFALHDIPVFYCDLAVKDIFNNPDSIRIKNALVNLCGDDCYTSEGKWNVSHISKLAETDKTILDRISTIIQPILLVEIMNFKNANQKELFVGVESALFPKSSALRGVVDKMILVTAPLEVRIKRIKERDPHRSDNDIITLLYNQIAPQINYDYILDNGVDPVIDIESQVNLMLEKL